MEPYFQNLKGISKFVMNELKFRFPDLRVIENFDLFDFPKLRKNKPEDIASSKQKLSLLIAHYFPSGTLENLRQGKQIKEDWNLVLDFLINDKIWKEKNDKELEDYYLQIVSDLVPALNLIFERAVTLPLSTVECERGFSRLGIIKNKLRNRLEAETVDRLMRISLCGPDRMKKIDFEAFYSKWDSKKSRNPNSFFKPV
jgi:hypothetical protein